MLSALTGLFSKTRSRISRPVLFPIIVPRSYFDLGNFPGNRFDLCHPALSVTWVELKGEGSMSYVNFERESKLARSTLDLHDLALANLRSSGPLFTHQKEVDGHCLWMSMNHSDGLGTSRLLLLRELASAVPAGFKVGIPERSCGIVIPSGLSDAQQLEGTNLVARCFDDGCVPMLNGVFDPCLFEIAMPNPSVDPTNCGKPQSAAHLER